MSGKQADPNHDPPQKMTTITGTPKSYTILSKNWYASKYRFFGNTFLICLLMILKHDKSVSNNNGLHRKKGDSHISQTSENVHKSDF